MTQQQILAAILEGTEVSEAIDSLPWSSRIEIRELLGDVPQPRNLWFDYARQEWIG